MSTSAVSAYLYLLDSAFESSRWHSVVGNLKSLQAGDWTWMPLGSDRSIQYIVEHLGVCRITYGNHTFGDGSLRWEDRLIDDDSVFATFPSAIEWLRARNDEWRQSVAALPDEDLLVRRKTNWGDMAETRWIISTMIEHDIYHAGEINYMRTLHNQESNWYKDDFDRSIQLAKLAQIAEGKP